MAAGHALPKREVYGDYLAFCRANQLEATNAPAFGKILRMVFPGITSRRLGRRGQTSHHYNHFRRRPTGRTPAPHLNLPGGLLSAITAGLGWTSESPSSTTSSSPSPPFSSSSAPSSNVAVAASPIYYHQAPQAYLPPKPASLSPLPPTRISRAGSGGSERIIGGDHVFMNALPSCCPPGSFSPSYFMPLPSPNHKGSPSSSYSNYVPSRGTYNRTSDDHLSNRYLCLQAHTNKLLRVAEASPPRPYHRKSRFCNQTTSALRKLLL